MRVAVDATSTELPPPPQPSYSDQLDHWSLATSQQQSSLGTDIRHHVESASPLRPCPMPACDVSPADRRRQVRKVGSDLLRHHGRKRYYTVREVKDANARQDIHLDFTCWSHAAFNSHQDFDDYHQSIGESCDYVAMKSEMLSSVSDATDTSWFDFDLSWLDFPDIDFSLFDFLDV